MEQQTGGWCWLVMFAFCLSCGVACAADKVYRPSLGPLDTSQSPTVDELVASGQLGGPLHPTKPYVNTPLGRAMNLDFGRAIELWNRHDFTNAVTLFRQHTATYPESPWRDEADLHCACDAVYLGRWPEADTLLNGILERQAVATDEPNVMMRAKARLRLGTLRVSENDLEGAGTLFATLRKESPDWRHRTYADHWIHRLVRMKRDELQLRACGTRALAVVQERLGNPDQAAALCKVRAERASGQRAAWLADVAEAHGLKLQPRIITDPAELAQVKPPAVVHIAPLGAGKSGHYWVFVGTSGDMLEFVDPTSGTAYRQTACELAAQWSGVVLALPGAAKVGRLAKAEDLLAIEGGCCGVPRPESFMGEPGPIQSPRSSGDKNPCGFPVWDINMANMNVTLSDIPLWYSPVIGPAVGLRLTYNSQSAIAYHEPFGAKWSSNFSSYLIQDTSGNVTVFMPDGARHTYAWEIVTPTETVLRAPAGIFNDLYRSRGVAADGSDIVYQLTLTDGTVYTYRQPTPNTNRQYFLTEVRDTDNLALTYSYATNGLLNAVSDAQGSLTAFSYNANGLCTRVTDPFGRHADFSYSEDGTLSTITDMGGYTASLTYDANIYVTSMGNEKGIWKFKIEPSDGVGLDSVTAKYPAPGDPMWQDYRVTVTDPLGATEEFFYFGGVDIDPVTGRDRTGYAWHITPRYYTPWTSMTHNNYTCQSPRTVYNFVYNSVMGELSDLIASIVRPRGNESYFNGSIMVPLGDGEFYTYDSQRNITSVSNSLGQVWRMSYNAIGRVAARTDPADTTVSYSYAPNLSDVTQVTTVTGTVTYVYDDRRHVTSVYDPYSNRWRYGYNAYGQLTNAVDPEGRTTSYGYDAQSRLASLTCDDVQVSSFGYDALNRMTSHATSDGRVWRWAFNTLDAVTNRVGPDGVSTMIEYSDCCPRLASREVDELGHATSFSYDGRRRLTSQTGKIGEKLEIAYDADGHIVRLTDANGHATSFAVNEVGLVVRETNAVGAVVSLGYDVAGNVTTRTNSRGQSVVWLRDAAGRVTEERHAGVLQNSYAYDQLGQITQASGPWGVKSFAYDRLGRMTSITYPDKLAVGQQFTSAGLLAAVAYPNSFRVDYCYDGRGQPTNVAWTGGGWVALTYGAAGELIRERRSNGTTTEYAHHAVGFVTNIWHQGPAGTLARIVIGRNALGAVVARSGLPLENAPAATNRMAQYDSANRVTQWGGASCKYDADGNLTNAAARGFVGVYDALNRLKGWTREGVQTEAAYDDEGDRVRTSSGAVTNRFAYSPNGNRVVDIFGNSTNFNIYVGDRLLARRTNSGTVCYHSDQVGNVILLTDEAGQAVRQYGYEPNGVIVAQSGSFTNNPFTYIGLLGVVDDGGGLYWMRARHYDAALGRFLQSDPIGWNGGPNVYAYADNDPLRKADPLGLMTVVDTESGSRYDNRGCAPARGIDLAPVWNAVDWVEKAMASSRILKIKEMIDAYKTGGDPRADLINEILEAVEEEVYYRIYPLNRPIETRDKPDDKPRRPWTIITET